MALTANYLKPQVDLPVFENLRPAPAVSSAISCSCAADNSNFHNQHGRYIYYLIAAASFYRYDTWTDTYQQLSSPPITPLTWASMRFAGAKGYEGRVISAVGNNGFQASIPFAHIGKTFDLRITDGTGKGQRRIITDVASPVIADYGSATGGAVTSITDTNKAWAINQWVGYGVRIISGAGVGQFRKILYNDATSMTVSNTAKYPEDINCNVQFGVTPAAGSIYQIESCVVTVDTNFGTNPDATSRFTIESGGIYLATSLATAFYCLAYYDILSDTWYIKTASSTIISATGTDGAIERTTENATIWERGIANATGSDTTHLADTTKNWVVNQWAGKYVRIFTGTGEGQLKKIDSNTSTILTWTGAVGNAPDGTSRYLIMGFDAGTCSGASVSDTANSVSCTASAYGNVLTVTAVGSGVLLSGQTLKGAGLGAVIAFSNATSSGAVITVGSTTGVQVGMVFEKISGTGTLAAGVNTVVSVNSSTTFTITTAPGVALSGTNVFMVGGGLGGQTAWTGTTGSSSSTLVTVNSTTNLQVGMAPFVTAGTGLFVQGTIITAINSGTTFTVDTAPSTPLSGATVVACFPIPATLGAQITGTPGSTGTYFIYPLQPVVSSTTVTGSGLALLVDSSKSTWPVNRWNNLMVRITAGTGKGQVRTIQATIPGYLSVSPDWTTALDNSSTYEIQGDYDKLYLMLGGNASVYVQNLAADIMTTGRLEEYGCAGGCHARYSDHPPISISGGVYSNPTLTITTVNPHNYKVGMSVTLSGDTGAGKAINNGTYTITVVASATTFVVSVGAGSANMTVPAQATNALVDACKNWAVNQWAGCIVTYNVAVPTQTTGLATVYSELIIGNSQNTLFFARAGTAPVQGITRYVITQTFSSISKAAIGAMDNGLSVGTNTTAILQDMTKYYLSSSSGGTHGSSGTTVTAAGNIKGLQVGMYVKVTGGTGAFAPLTKVATLISDTQFTVDQTPTTTLSGATVEGTFWMAGQHNGRRARIIAGPGMFQEWNLTGSTVNTLTMAAITTAPATGTSVYELIPIPARALSVQINWIYGCTDSAKKGSWIYSPRGTSPLIDRLNIQNDTWEIVQLMPQIESFTTGTQWAYDGVDKIWIIVNGTLRMLYLDIYTGIVHGGMMLPYIVGTAIIGNRTEIFSTQDGLKYLWTNRQSQVECFRALIYW